VWAVLGEFGEQEGTVDVLEEEGQPFQKPFQDQRDHCCARVRAACQVEDFQQCFRELAQHLPLCGNAAVAINTTCPFCGAGPPPVGPEALAGAMAWCERAAQKHAGKPAAGRDVSEHSDAELTLEAKALQESLTGKTLMISPDCICGANDWPVHADQPCSESADGPSQSKYYPAHCLPGWCMVPEHHMGGGRKIQWASLANGNFLLKMVVPREDTAGSCVSTEYQRDFEHLYIENQASKYLRSLSTTGITPVPYSLHSEIFEVSVAAHDGARLASFTTQKPVKLCPGETWPAFLSTRICGTFHKPPGSPPTACDCDWSNIVAESCGRIRSADEQTTCFRSVANRLLSLESLVANHSLLLGDIQLIANEYGITFFDTMVAPVEDGPCGPVTTPGLSVLCLKHSQARNFLLQGAFRFLVALLGGGSHKKLQQEFPPNVQAVISQCACPTTMFMAKVPPSVEELFQASAIGQEFMGRLQALFGSSSETETNATDGFVCTGSHGGRAPTGRVKPPKEWANGHLLGSEAWQAMVRSEHVWTF
jgi:hypothetical protein